LKLYVGSRNYKPDGYVTVDIDPANKPDIVADITNMTSVMDASCDEVVAGHVLEHIEWPDSFAAIAEFARVLKPGGVVKIAVPDMASLMRMLLSGESAFHVMGLIYGLGGRVNTFERHRYGFTPGMLADILETLGFGEFDWWNSSLADASNGWAPRGLDERIGMSLNMQAVKTGTPSVDPKALYQELLRTPMDDFVSVSARLRGREAPDGQQPDRAVSPKLLQLMHFQLIEAQQRIRHLEGRPPAPSQQAGLRDEPSRLRSAVRRLIARL
jgi:SAM-dependent methyltransferase